VLNYEFVRLRGRTAAPAESIVTRPTASVTYYKYSCYRSAILCVNWK